MYIDTPFFRQFTILSERTNESIRRSARLGLSLIKAKHLKDYHQMSQEDVDCFKAIWQSVEREENITRRSERFSGHAFMVTSIRRALRYCFCSNLYLGIFQPLQNVMKFIEGKSYNEGDIDLFIDCLYNSMIEEIGLATLVSNEPVLIDY